MKTNTLATHLNKTLGLAAIAASAASFPLAARAAAADAAPAPAQQTPNIVLVVADDFGWTDLGCTGSKYYESPNIDRFAAQGMRFTCSYTMPNCAPTRSCLWTGKYSPRTGIYTVGNSDRGKSYDRQLIPPKNITTLPLDIPTMPELIRGSGYMTAMYGKWHLGHDAEHGPAVRGFDDTVWYDGGSHFDFKPKPDRPHPKGQFLADFLADQGIAFMRKAREAKKPFLLVITHFAVHRPLQAPQAEIDHFKSKPTVGGHDNPIYAGMIRALDSSFGRVVKALDDLGIADNTLIIFTSDNGGLTVPRTTDNAPLRGGKGMHYEGGVRVPFIARWPGVIKPGATCDTPIHVIDFIPTLLDILHRAPATDTVLDGLSYLPLLKGQPDKAIETRALYWHCPVYLEGDKTVLWRSTPSDIIRQGPWKLIETYAPKEIELYNLAADLSETTNLAKQQPQLTAELLAKLHQWRDDLRGAMPVPNPDYHKATASKNEKKNKKNKKTKVGEEGENLEE